MSVSHRELDLSLSQRHILRKIRHFGISKATVHANPEKYKFLFTYYLIDNDRSNHERYVLQEKAHMYFRYRRKDLFRFWFPTIISIIALLAAYDAYTIPLLERVLQTIVQTVKTTLESLGNVF